MGDNLLLGIGRRMLPIPPLFWHRRVSRGARQLRASLSFMSPEHHVIRDFAVRELPRLGQPMPPEFIGQSLNLPLSRVKTILEDLERHMTFLFRNEDGEVTWAYPVTVEHTPHRVSLSTGEQIYAAWAVDAIAVPFVQGLIRREQISGNVATECAHCHQPLHFGLDSAFKYQVEEAEAKPVLFAPMSGVEPGARSIIDGFWRKSVFFWSEEHAREHRRRLGGIRGTYETLAQGAYVTPRIQGALFAFSGPR